MTVREFLRRARAAGWTVEQTRRHYRLRHPEAARPIIMPSTPSCHRALANAAADMRRALREPPDTGRSHSSCGQPIPKPRDCGGSPRDMRQE
jgi:hypothetical protein